MAKQNVLLLPNSTLTLTEYDNNKHTTVYQLQLFFCNQTVKKVSLLGLETQRNRHIASSATECKQASESGFIRAKPSLETVPMVS